jgi:hypothetical protein
MVASFLDTKAGIALPLIVDELTASVVQRSPYQRMRGIRSSAEVDLHLDTLLAAYNRYHSIARSASIVLWCRCWRSRPMGSGYEGNQHQPFGIQHLCRVATINGIASLPGPGVRLVSLCPTGSRSADVNIDDPAFKPAEYAPVVAYGRARTVNDFCRGARPPTQGLGHAGDG